MIKSTLILIANDIVDSAVLLLILKCQRDLKIKNTYPIIMLNAITNVFVIHILLGDIEFF